jgi:hypothetical protein
VSTAVTTALFAFVVVAIAAGWWFSADQVAKRRLKAEPAVPSRGLLPGQVAKVTGRVVLLEALESPMTRTACAHWRLKIEVPQGKNSWRTVVDHEDSTPFLLDDHSGQPVMVFPGVAKVVLEMDTTGSTGLFDDAKPEEARVLAEHGLDATMLGLNRRYRFSEGALSADEEVSVLGEVELREVDGQMRVVLVPPPDGPLLISDAQGVHG